MTFLTTLPSVRFCSMFLYLKSVDECRGNKRNASEACQGRIAGARKREAIRTFMKCAVGMNAGMLSLHAGVHTDVHADVHADGLALITPSARHALQHCLIQHLHEEYTEHQYDYGLYGLASVMLKIACAEIVARYVEAAGDRAERK